MPLQVRICELFWKSIDSQMSCGDLNNSIAREGTSPENIWQILIFTYLYHRCMPLGSATSATQTDMLISSLTQHLCTSKYNTIGDTFFPQWCLQLNPGFGFSVSGSYPQLRRCIQRENIVYSMSNAKHFCGLFLLCLQSILIDSCDTFLPYCHLVIEAVVITHIKEVHSVEIRTRSGRRNVLYEEWLKFDVWSINNGHFNNELSSYMAGAESAEIEMSVTQTLIHFYHELYTCTHQQLPNSMHIIGVWPEVYSNELCKWRISKRNQWLEY